MAPATKFGANRTFKLCWTGFILALTVLPYLIGHSLIPKGYFYTWIIPPYPADSLAYFAWSRQAYNGRLLFSLKYTAIPQKPFIFNPFFLICGWLSRCTGLELGPIHLIVKSIGVLLFYSTFFKLIAHFKLTRMQSTVASVLVGVASGFGAILQSALGFPAVQDFVFGIKSVQVIGFPDLLTVDWNTLWSLVWNPLFPYSLAVILGSIYAIDKAVSKDLPKQSWLCGLLVGLLSLIHPYPVVPLIVLLILLAIIRNKKKALTHLARAALAAAPFLVYLVSVYVSHPILQQHSATGEMTSPPWMEYFIGFGFPLMLGIVGMVLQFERIIDKTLPFLLWILVDVVFSRIPCWFQAKMMFGVHVPICILAAISFDAIIADISNVRTKYLAITCAVLMLPLIVYSQIIIFEGGMSEMRSDADEDFGISPEKMAGLLYLRGRGDPESVVFAGLANSALIAAYSGNTVLWGHWAQAVDFQERIDWYQEIFGARSGLTDQQRSDRFWSAGIKYIFVEGAAVDTPQWMLSQSKEVFKNKGISIYEHLNKPLLR